MNFFGHAVAASWRRPTPRFVLGAMLPDFAVMAGGRLAAVDPARAPELASGIEWHHLTDAVFHRLEPFRRWSRELTALLSAGGVSRGPSLAAGHVGVELLLDGALVDREPEVAEIYTAALGEVREVAALIEWRGPRPPIAGLATELARRGLPVGYRDPEVVASRVARVLSRRPRLAMPATQVPLLVDALVGLRPRLEAGLDGLVSQLEAGLGA